MSSYAVDKVCRRLMVDLEFRAAVRERGEAALGDAQPPLSDGELAALRAGDVGHLSRAGANHFLLHQLGRLELFGLDLKRYAERIREEYAQERARMRTEGLVTSSDFGADPRN